MPPPNRKGPDPLEVGLPQDIDAERLVLGSILVAPDCWDAVSGLITAEDFLVHRHSLIFGRMADIRGRGEPIDRIVLAHELRRAGQLEAVEGLSFLVTLDEGLPEIPNPAQYAKIVREKSALRRIIFQARDTMNRALEQGSSPEEILGDAKAKFQNIEDAAVSGKGDGGRTPLEIIENFPGGISAFLDPTSRRRGLPTGFTKFDEMTGGLHDGELIIVAARPGGGKSAWMMNIAEYVTLGPKLRRSVAVFSLEMTDDSLLTRMLCSVARVDQMKFRANYLNKEERSRIQEALSRVTETRLKLYDRASVLLPELCSIIRRLVRDEGLHVAMIDYLQLIGSHRRSENRNQEISDMTRQFKLLAKECEIPIVLLSQLSRAGDKRNSNNNRPILSDLRDSGSIEQDSDMVVFIHRDEMHRKGREDNRGLAELIIAKQRNGPTGVSKVRFIGSFVRFENRAEEADDPSE